LHGALILAVWFLLFFGFSFLFGIVLFMAFRFHWFEWRWYP